MKRHYQQTVQNSTSAIHYYGLCPITSSKILFLRGLIAGLVVELLEPRFHNGGSLQQQHAPELSCNINNVRLVYTHGDRSTKACK